MKANVIAIFTVMLFTICPPPALYAADQGHGGQVHQGRGIVETIDPAAGQVTLEHEAIESLNWPSMVMDFKVREPVQLKGLKEGDQVQFDLVVQGKTYYITRIEPIH